VSREQPRLLVSVEDDGLRARLAEVLAEFAPELDSRGGAAALQLLARQLTLRLLVVVESGGSAEALDLLREARALREDVAVIVLSERPTIEHATEAIRRGAEDFVPIPFSEELLRKEVARVLEAVDLRDRVESLCRRLSDAQGFEAIVSASPRMERVFEIARAAARTETPVLVVGETGTGKELFARAIHAGSRRSTRPFVALNCAALPRELVESELFGHRRGAFSGADRDSAGLFVAAHGGTLFLDEIGELPGDAQAKLLRVLQDGEVRPVGGLESRRVAVRVIAATNRRLAELRAEALRQDLFFRLSVLIVDLPPLRERLEDVPRLVAHFLARLRERDVTKVEGLDTDAQDLLLQYSFPGNVRELENMLEGLSVMLPPQQSVIRAADVRAWFKRRGAMRPAPAMGSEVSLRLDDLEAWAIREALRRSAGNKTEAAHLLGISRDTLYRKLQEITRLGNVSESRTASGKP
jgi:two-component system response regulator HydG